MDGAPGCAGEATGCPGEAADCAGEATGCPGEAAGRDATRLPVGAAYVADCDVAPALRGAPALMFAAIALTAVASAMMPDASASVLILNRSPGGREGSGLVSGCAET